MLEILHIGCGNKKINSVIGYNDINCKEYSLDIDPAFNPDILADITKPIFFERTFDHVVSEHFLEHFHQHELDIVLHNMKSALKDGGLLVSRMPDLQSVAQAIITFGLDYTLYESDGGPINARDMLYGADSLAKSGFEYHKHKTGFTSKTLRILFEKHGFRNIKISRLPLRFELEIVAEK